ncbi:Aste57867_2117 [Aphanomyces stellatus]|uniref:Aste57867_2117 protein n=1 Tax=Aphanomyces stellatus TaxID=120398 RepID=A0A485K6X5_9STRA|nr:hypothetical protein As57867_002112 [Aphanomyces stellatus]VFT79320.1 Aste57867_2117 [Aphanomyces stellatus]
MEQQQLTAIKVGYKGEIHRLRVDLAGFKYEDLNALFESTFTLAPGSFVIQYKDQESDHVNVKSTADFDEACSFFLSSTDVVKSLRFIAVPSTQAVFQENVADPVLKVIEQLVKSLNEAMEKVKQEQYLAKAHENARVFASKAQENAGVWSVKAQEAMSTTGVALNETLAHTSVIVNEKLAEAGAVLGPIANKTVEESKAAFEAAKKSLNEIEFDKIKQSLNEIEFDRIMKDATDGMKSAAAVASTYAANLVNELNKLKEQADAAPAAMVVEAVAAPAPVEVEATPVAVPIVEIAPAAEVVAEAEWEQVQDEVTAPAVVVESKWAAQMMLIREVFPSADDVAVEALLDASNGDVHVVLNQLVDL